jgi:anti-sigma regulatory factor (Ser/Thr protein kinase)
MPNAFEICIPATVSGLVTALATIDQFCAARNLNADSAARARVVAEELISNTIKYGYRGECDRPIRLRLRAEPVLTLVYEDQAGPFDPTRWRPDEEWTAASRERQEGRAGVALVMGLSSAAEYQRTPDGNRLVIAFAPRGAPSPGAPN